MTDFETHPAGTAARIAELTAAQKYRYIGKDGKPVLARNLEDRIEQLEAELTRATQNNDMMFAKGMSHGQQVMKDTGRLVIVDSPELVELREALTRANAATAAAYEVAANVCENEALKAMRNGIQYAYDGRTALYHKIRALATPDQTAALDKLIAEAVGPYLEALSWYGEQARLARLIHSEGDAGRNALQADGGKRARAALALIGEKK